MSDSFLLAVDPPDTKVREGAFLSEINPDSEIRQRLLIASVLPPSQFCKISAYDAQRNAYRLQGEPGNFHLYREHISRRHSLDPDGPVPVISAVYEFQQQGYFVESILVTEKRVRQVTYEEFRKSEDFERTKKTLGFVLEQFPHIEFRYNNPSLYTSNWNNEATEERVLVSILTDLFNKTLSIYCQRFKIPTLRKRGLSLSFGNHSETTFNAPLRKIEGTINLGNLYAHLHGESLPFNEQSLRAMGLEFQTT